MEVLVAMSIMILVSFAAAYLMNFSWRSNRIVWEQLSTQNEGRKAVRDFVNELRSAAASDLGSYPVNLADQEEIIFYSNIDEDTYREMIRYYLDDTTLMKSVTKPTGTPLAYDTEYEVLTEVAHDVDNGGAPLFYYYDHSYSGATPTAYLPWPVETTDVRMVGISLVLEEDPTSSPVPFNIESKVSIRNLKDN